MANGIREIVNAIVAGNVVTLACFAFSFAFPPHSFFFFFHVMWKSRLELLSTSRRRSSFTFPNTFFFFFHTFYEYIFRVLFFMSFHFLVIFFFFLFFFFRLVMHLKSRPITPTFKQIFLYRLKRELVFLRIFL